MIDYASIIRNSPVLSALKALIAVKRAEDAKYSLSYLSKGLGIKSRSYLSEVLKGTKRLSPKHIAPLVDMLEIPIAEAELLRAKLLLEFGDLSPLEFESTKRQVLDAEKKLISGTVEIRDVRDINLVMLLIACLHLFSKGSATRREILDLFPREKHLEVERGLSDLLQNGLVVRIGDAYSYSPEYQNLLHLYTATTKKNEVDYLQGSMEEAKLAAENYDKAASDSIFYSGIITASYSEYLASMEHVKQNLRSIQSRIEAQSADTLVRFNVQIYPVITKHKGLKK